MTQKNLLFEADNCVYCGLCSQYCPTYALEHQELESPRGRVLSSIQVLQGGLDMTMVLEQHLKNCLFCGACERACPAKVPVIELLSMAKSRFKQEEAKNIRWLIKHPMIFKFLAGIGVIVKKLNLAKLPIIKQYQHLLPNKISAIKNHKQGNSILLFGGCSTSLDHDFVKIKNLLSSCGIDFDILTENCCGAVHAHAGDVEYADMLLAKNQQDFADYKTLIYASTGCQDYLTRLENSNLQVTEASEFLSSQNLSNLKLKPLAKTVAVHIPCSQCFNLKAKSQIQNLLCLIPDLQIKFIKTMGCCGASKLYADKALSQQNMQNEYIEPSIKEIQQLAPDIVVSSNLACRLNLQAATHTVKINVKIMHPLSLLNQQL